MALQTKEHAANVLCREVTAQVPRGLQSATRGCGGDQGEGYSESMHRAAWSE